MESNNIFAKMNVVRTELNKSLEKGGKNSYSHYDYFQLQDFIPSLLRLCNDNGLFTQFWIGKDKIEQPTEIVEVTTIDETGNTITTKTTKENFAYAEFAHLVVYDVESGDTLEFTKETAPCSLSGAQPIQNLGSKTTYMKRYMYMDAFEIVEGDKIEDMTGMTEPKVEKKAKTTTSKPKVAPVTTQPVYVEAPTVEAMYETNTQPTPVVEQVSAQVTSQVQPTIEASVEVQAEQLMSLDTKSMLANMIKEAGLEPRDEIVNFARELGTDVPLLKESDKDKIIELLNKKVGR